MQSPTTNRSRSRWLPLFVATVGLLGWVFGATAVTLKKIPDPRPGGWVVDQTETLSPRLESQLNGVAERVHEQGGELVVVVVDNLSGAQPRRFATDLGNRWNLNPRGVLMLLAKGSRAAEIILGRQVESAAQIRTSQQIMDSILVPSFRSGRYGEGLLAGAQAIEKRILGPEAVTATAPDRQQSSGSAEIGAQGLMAEEAELAREARQSGRTAPPAESPSSGLGGILAKALAFLLAAGAAIQGAIWVLRPPRCKSCDVPRVQLGEYEEDAHLSAPERLEETLDSVDYRLWACPSCGDVLKRRHKRWLTRQKRCPACNFVTMSQVETVLEQATSASSGLAEVVEDCTNCDYHSTTTTTIPRVTSSSSHSSSSSGGGSFSSGSGASGSW
ncbi:MAG: TPM domain-containing protein [Deltaproteobacteria bacterium]|nr:TPM domain-containing protein [Deltaproteobacteria bacterium]